MTRLPWRRCVCSHLIQQHDIRGGLPDRNLGWCRGQTLRIGSPVSGPVEWDKCLCSKFRDSSIRVALHYWAWRHREELIGAALLTLPWVGLIVAGQMLK